MHSCVMDIDGEFEHEEFDAAFAKGRATRAEGSRPAIRRPDSTPKQGGVRVGQVVSSWSLDRVSVGQSVEIRKSQTSYESHR